MGSRSSNLTCSDCQADRVCLRHARGFLGATLRPGETLTIAQTDCKVCGQIHTRCHAHNRQGGPCGNGRSKNQNVCRLHGGARTATKLAAARRGIEEAAAKEFRRRWTTNGEEPVTDPLAELAKVAGEVVAFKDELRTHVDKLDGALAYWIDREFYGPDGEILRSEAAEQLRAIVQAYERAQERAANVLAMMVKLDIAGRMVEVRAGQAALVVGAIREGLAGVDMAAEVRAATLTAIADALDNIATPDPTPKELLP